jgi:hypothetical protein
MYVPQHFRRVVPGAGRGPWSRDRGLRDFTEDLFADAALGEWLGEGDHAQGETPPIGTNHVAAQILAHALGLDPEMARGFAAFGVGRRGQQAEPTRQVTSLVDVGFTGADGRRVNLEVDPRGQTSTHAEDHRRAMEAAVRSGRSPGSARSVFVGTDERGQIREIRHVRYVAVRDPRGRTVRVESREGPILTFPGGITPAEAWQRGLLQRPPQRAARPAARAPSAPRASRRLGRPMRFADSESML